MKKIKKYWTYFIYLICILMLIIPISATFYVFDEIGDGEWVNNYTLNTFEYSIIIIPIILSFILIPRQKRIILKRILIINLCLLSGIASLFAFQTIVISIQDFVPHWGMLIILILFPIAIINSSIEWKRAIEPLEGIEYTGD
ncbi:MAG: hypothetical protein ACI94Y_003246 [Maribacter sp.]|jgi:hypothetical protein